MLFVAPEEAACNLINCLQWCHSVAKWVMKAPGKNKRAGTGVVIFIPHVLLPFPDLLPTLPTMHLSINITFIILFIRFRAFSRRFRPKQVAISTFVTFNAMSSSRRSLKKMSLESFVEDCGRVIPLSWHQSGACSTTEVPEQKESRLCWVGFVCSQRWGYQSASWCSRGKCSCWGVWSDHRLEVDGWSSVDGQHLSYCVTSLEEF